MHPTLTALSSLSAHLTRQPFKRAQTGLFGGKVIQFGNNVPFSKHKTRRTWLPNVQRKDLRSEILGRELSVKVTTRALRTIRKYGGLDKYILNTHADELSPQGMRIRIMLRDKQEELARTNATQATAASSGSPLTARANVEGFSSTQLQQ